MPIMTIDASAGAITGLAAGGLPDATVATADIVDGAVTAAKLSGLTITQANQTPLPAAASLLSYTHGIGATPAWADVELVCLTADLNYSIGDIVNGFTAGSAAYAHPFSVNKTATVVEARVGSTNGFYVANKTTGVATVITNLSSWAWRFKVRAA